MKNRDFTVFPIFFPPKFNKTNDSIGFYIYTYILKVEETVPVWFFRFHLVRNRYIGINIAPVFCLTVALKHDTNELWGYPVKGNFVDAAEFIINFCDGTVVLDAVVNIPVLKSSFQMNKIH